MSSSVRNSAEIVLEHSCDQHRRHRGQASRGEHAVASGAEHTQEVEKGDRHEPDPDRQGRQPSLGGDLDRHVVQVRVDRFGGAGLNYP